MKSYQEPSILVLYVDACDVLTASIGDGGYEDGELKGVTDSFVS